jgi:2-C-methyl-D-erythritol 4-phosphate cytidylyltransferase/2-C-methyl-D-erythritol 2,4-cyclodiphosphate synthase
VIVVAAGSGNRLGRNEPKAFVALSGRSILERALDAVFGMNSAVQVVVVVPSDKGPHSERLVLQAAGSAADHVTIVTGGATRQRSVAAGIAVLEPGVRTVLVHDAARALTPTALFELVVEGVESLGVGVIPAIAVADTIKQVDASSAVKQTLDRSTLVAVQTPQGFPRAELEAAYESANEEYTDDAALFAAAGHDVRVVEGDARAFKITTSWDLRRAEALLGGGMDARTGVGIDIHAYDDSAPLWLGGLYWPDEPGLAGHSDGDAVSHAMCDALLSAAGLGDIGGRFGTSEERFRGAHGDVFLRETVALVKGAGFDIGNVSVQVVANHPKIASRRSELESYLTALVGAPVSIGATTADGLGFAGNGEGVAVIATALVSQHR